MHAFGSAPRLEIRGKGVYPPKHTQTPIYPTSSSEAKGVRILEPLDQKPTIALLKPR